MEIIIFELFHLKPHPNIHWQALIHQRVPKISTTNNFLTITRDIDEQCPLMCYDHKWSIQEKKSIFVLELYFKFAITVCRMSDMSKWNAWNFCSCLLRFCLYSNVSRQWPQENISNDSGFRMLDLQHVLFEVVLSTCLVGALVTFNG